MSTSLSVAAIQEAIEQIKVHCRNSIEAYKAGNAEYEMLSVRGVLYTLGYNEPDADVVIVAIAEAGFGYCVDPIIPVKSPTGGKTERPAMNVCYWGVDQLLSRLNALRILR